MIEIPLTKGYVAIVDDEDADLAGINWRVTSAKRSNYVTTTVRRNGKVKTIFLHRLIVGRVLGRNLESSEHIDHVDTDGLNNTRVNLRVCSRQQNQWNRRNQSNSSSGFKGVTRISRFTPKTRNTWAASINYNGKRIHLGLFPTAEEAHEAYKQAAEKYFGEFARAA